MLAYLDPSSIDAAIRSGRSPGDFLGLLAARGYTPVASHMVLHELARPVVSRKWSIAIKQCRFLRDLAPSWHVSARDLFRREVAFFRTHEPITPVLDPETLKDTQDELDGLCEGQIRASLREAIEERNKAKATEWQESMRASLTAARELRQKDPSAASHFGTLREFKDHHAPNVALFLATVPSTQMSTLEAHSLARQLDTYPAIQANVNYWLYMAFIVEKHRVVPAHDRLDDFRHAAEATYCRALVSNDKGLLRALPDIAPRVQPLPWLDLLTGA